MTLKFTYTYLLTFCICIFLYTGNIYGQAISPSPKSISSVKQALSSDNTFIENIGQYGKTMKGFENMGNIQLGYEDLGMPVLFTPKGLIHLQRKTEKISHAEEERLEKQGVPENEIERKRNVTDRTITMEWVGANLNVEIIKEEKTSAYHTYGLLKDKAAGYKKITYKNLYPGIDIIYNFTNNAKAGFEYSLIVQPGADLSLVKMKYGGDVKNIKTDSKGNLVVRSDIDGIEETIPVSYYSDKIISNPFNEVKSVYKIEDKEIGFSFPQGYDKTKAFIIDPFVSGTGNLLGLNAGKARDVDFDYAGNIYVTGGGSQSTAFSLAKYNAAGVLQWTFNGAMTIPSWTSNSYYGGWMVEKPTGNIYIGQGFIYPTGFRVIRISTTGLYDNYITTANGNFTEAWKMFWSCNNGSPQILIAGGGINSNINFGVFNPPSTTVTSLNVTGIPYSGPSGGWAQDIADFVFDPVNNEMYSIYGSLFGTPSLNNKIYKNTAPYSAASIAWNVASGYNTVSEAANRPYLGASLVDNSANMLWVNASYLYYWDGKNLKAFDKATGAGVGTPLTTANTAFMQGGIIADACNNIFVGEGNGVIKVYNFNGTTFSDAPADISDIHFAGKAVYDLAYDEAKKLLYASGDGFVASFDVSAYCAATIFTVNVVPNCVTASATATVSPAPPGGSTVTYTLFNGSTQIAVNTTGIFTGLNPNITYTVKAIINFACSGSQATTTFIIPGPTVAITATNTICGANTGTITATGSGIAGPYTYNINGGAFQAGGNFTGLAAGIYTIIVKDAGGCPNTAVVTILNSNGPALTFAQTNAGCGSNNGTVTATVTGGTAPYQYSINNGATYQSGNFFTGLVGGQYILVVKDATGCTNTTIVNITSSPAPLINAIPAAATCGNNNGSITAFGSGGTAPLQYSINGNTFQASGFFANLTPGAYTVTVKDANGCIQTTGVTVANSPAPTVTAVPTAASCNNVNGSITATGLGGIAPLQYSINGTVFVVSNIFTGLAAGTYNITVKDATGCTSTTTVTIGSIGGPTVTASSTVSVCNSNTGSITAAATAGTPGYQYSINGVSFQASNIFNGLAAGNYVVYVKDAIGCVGTVSIIVSNTAGPSITAVAAPTACNVNNGSITITASGGTPGYLYSIDDITYVPGNIFSGLGAGINTVYVKDANGCIKSTAVTIVNISGLSLTVSSIISSCGTSSGVVTAVATGGAAPLTYSINGTIYFASNVFTGVAAGTYTVYVKDNNGCIVTKQVTVTSAAAPVFSVTVLQNATCGTASGVIRVNASGGIAPLSYNIDGGAFQLINIFINVAPGVHTIIVKDAAGCAAPAQTVTITNSGTGTAPTDVTFVVNNVLGCTGEGRIKNLKGVPSGGGRNYEFSLDGGPFTTANQFRPVSIGTHTITAREVGSVCTVTRLATIGNGTPATATATATASACGGTTGTITIAGVGANRPYHASIDGGVTWITFDPTTTFTGLAPGTYSIIIADDADFKAGPPDIPGACLTTIFVAVPSTGGPTISTTQTNATCTSSNGSITAFGVGTAPLSYNINGGPYFASGVFNNLAPGVYAVTVKDGTGCITGVNVTLANPSVPAVTAIVSATSCNINNGTITATGTGGAAPLEYSINGTIFQSSNIFNGLATGSYTLYVKDANQCYSTFPVTIANTALPKVTAFTVAATCNNNDGTIVAEGSLGTAPYTFSINGTAYQSSTTVPNLPAGFYTVYIKDDRGCITTTGVTVENIGAPGFTFSNANANCGNANGSISIFGTGGTPPYQYSSNGGTTFQPGPVFSLLLSGNYTIVLKDANGCIATKVLFVGITPGPQTLTASVVNAACGLANGSITATGTGGTGALQYSRDGITYQASGVFNLLPAGSYTIYVRDVNSCVKTLPVTVLNLSGTSLTATSSPASCGLSDGSITAIATGGTLPLTYSKDGIIFQTSNIFLNLAAGPYTITVRDVRNCSTTFNITVTIIGAAVTPTFNPVASICSGAVLTPLSTTSTNGINGTWAPALNNTATTTYTFTPTIGQCATTATLTITVNANIVPTFTPVASICSGTLLTPLPTTSTNGITGTWSPALNNTTTTTYTFTPTAGQCATTATLTITVNTNVVPTFNPVAAICSGTILTPLPTTSINGITGTWTPALNNTSTTTYTFTPAAGQCATPATLTVTVNVNVVPTFTPVAPICSGAILSPLPTTSINSITGAWAPALNNTATTTYTFTPTAGQCATTTTLTVTVNPILSATINCGVSTTSSVNFNWSALTGATGYIVSYQVNAGPVNNVGAIGNVLTYLVSGLAGGDNVTITVTPTGAAGTCFTSVTKTCTATACTPPTASISYAGPFCVNIVAPQAVTLTGTGTFAGGVYSAPIGLSIDAITGAITPGTSTPATYIVTYTVAASAGCAGVTATTSVTITPNPSSIIIYHN